MSQHLLVLSYELNDDIDTILIGIYAYCKSACIKHIRRVHMTSFFQQVLTTSGGKYVPWDGSLMYGTGQPKQFVLPVSLNKHSLRNSPNTGK
jgi:hypothetical protein